MSDPVYPLNEVYATPNDVTALLGALTYDVTDPFLVTALQRATRQIDRVKRFFPTRYVEQHEQSPTRTGIELFLKHSPVFAINSIGYGQSLVPVHNIRFDSSGVVSAYGYAYNFGYLDPSFDYPYAFGQPFVQVDYWTAYTLDVVGEILTTTDHATYSFVNNNLAKTLVPANSRVEALTPIYRPVISRNGIVLDPTAYTVDWTNGRITFGVANSSNDVISATYSYWFVPADINEACAKLAAIEVLKRDGVGVGKETGQQGASSWSMGEARTTYGRQDGYAWEGIITVWQADVKATLDYYKGVV